MRPLERNNNYFTVHGIHKQSYDGLVDMHTHLRGDTADSPTRILRTAKRRGLTGIVVTDHDRLRHLPRLIELNDKLKLGLDIFPGVESTAIVSNKTGESNKKAKHVLVFLSQHDSLTTEVPCYMPVDELNTYVHERGGKTAIAHPFLWDRNSLNESEILDAQNTGDTKKRFDFIEGHHGGVLNLLAFENKHPRVTARMRKLGLMPPIVDTNQKSQTLFRQKQQELGLTGITSGSDAHSTEHIGDVGISYNRSVGLFQSIQAGEYAILERQYRRPPSTRREEILGTLGGWKMEVERRFGINGFVIYDKTTN